VLLLTKQLHVSATIFHHHQVVYLSCQMSIHATCFLCYIWDLSRERGMIFAISRLNVLSILHVFLWLLMSTYIRICTTLTLIVCDLFVVPSFGVLYFPLHVLYLFLSSLVLLFLCCLSWQVSLRACWLL
jgi:hypothetical protein